MECAGLKTVVTTIQAQLKSEFLTKRASQCQFLAFGPAYVDAGFKVWGDALGYAAQACGGAANLATTLGCHPKDPCCVLDKFAAAAATGATVCGTKAQGALLAAAANKFDMTAPYDALAAWQASSCEAGSVDVQTAIALLAPGPVMGGPPVFRPDYARMRAALAWAIFRCCAWAHDFLGPDLCGAAPISSLEFGQGARYWAIQEIGQDLADKQAMDADYAKRCK